MVCIDLSDTDDRLVEQALLWANIFPECNRLILFHNIREEFLNETLPLSKENINKLMSNILASTKKRFANLIADKPIDWDIMVTFKPNSAKAIVDTSIKHNSSLLVMGKKRPGRGTGVIAQSVMALDKSCTPVLLVPPTKSVGINKVASCAELSIDEKPMFDFALKLHEQLDTVNQCLHVYKLPLAYFPYMEQNDQALEDATQKRAQERYKSFKKQAKLDGELWELVLRKGVQIADTVAIYAKEQALDLVIITRSGKNTPATYRVGSNAKKLMRTSIGIPMLIL